MRLCDLEIDTVKSLCEKYAFAYNNGLNKPFIFIKHMKKITPEEVYQNEKCTPIPILNAFISENQYYVELYKEYKI